MPIDPISASAIGLSALKTGYQLHQGNKLRKQGESLENSLNRYTYSTPDSIYANQSLAERNAAEGLTKEEENAYLDNINSTVANSISNFRGRKAGLVGAEVLGRQQSRSLRDLRSEDTRRRLDNQRILMQQNQVLANYQDKEFQLNEIDPYQDNLNYARSLQSAGRQTTNSAIDNLSDSANSYLSSYSNKT